MPTHYQHQLATDFLAPGDPERVHQTALRILSEVGLEVADEEALRQMAAAGYRVSGQRVFFAAEAVESFVEGKRELSRRERSPEPSQPAADDFTLHLSVGQYAHHVHDLDADRIVPYTVESLIEMTKLVDVLEERSVHSSAPGYPLDVSPPLQPIAKYHIQALYSRHGAQAVDPISAYSIPYVFEMAEVMGNPIRHLPVYVFSPLRLAGESLQVVRQYRDRIDGVGVGGMPSLGATAPVLPFGALALAAAEAIGGAMVVEQATGLPSSFGIGLHAFDLRFGTMVFGSPEAYLLGQLAPEINEYYSSGRPRRRRRGLASAGIHSRANFPGAQAAAEKAGLITAGALIGARWFDGAGILSVDEVFSAEQLLVDCEIKDQVQRLIAGLDMGDGGYDWVAEVQLAVQGSSFVALDSTLDNYRTAYWHPQLFDRGFLGSQGYEGRLKLAQRAREMTRSYVARHQFELDPARRREMERIWQRALRDLG
jgi:trimethylamine:corrinoid methyltransferase-like protein